MELFGKPMDWFGEIILNKHRLQGNFKPKIKPGGIVFWVRAWQFCISSVGCQYKHISDKALTIMFPILLICTGKIQTGKDRFYTQMKTLLILTSVPTFAVVSLFDLSCFYTSSSLLTSLEQFLIHICVNRIKISPSKFISSSLI